MGHVYPIIDYPHSVMGNTWGISGGHGEKTVANFDEDNTTIIVAAGLDCLNGINPETVDGLFLATTNSPDKERQNSTIVSTALDLRQIKNPLLGLTHNLGGTPDGRDIFVGIVGLE